MTDIRQKITAYILNSKHFQNTLPIFIIKRCVFIYVTYYFSYSSKSRADIVAKVSPSWAKNAANKLISDCVFPLAILQARTEIKVTNSQEFIKNSPLMIVCEKIKEMRKTIRE